MFLTIDTTKRETISIGLYNKKTWQCFEFVTSNQSDDILLSIDGILNKMKLKLRDLGAIFVNCGPGSYTGVRVGVTVANTLAWSLNIPVLSYSNDNFDNTILKIEKQSHFSQLALPIYCDNI